MLFIVLTYTCKQNKELQHSNKHYTRKFHL